MAGSKKKDEDEGIKLICRNKRAFHEYEVSDRLECGIVLTGTEVKSLRDGQGNLEDAYAKIEEGEVWLIGSDIPEYAMGNRMNHKPKRPRKLLLHRREIAKFAGKATQRGFTLVPLRMYFKQGLAKVEPEGATLVAYAAKEGHVAWDGEGGNSPFVSAIIKNIEIPGVEINFLFRKVRDEVLKATGGRQEPYVYGSLPAEAFYFRRP